ncbi:MULTISPECIES: response regulator transcription factor [unclassified Clostridium]|uniref:response regulator transcription factor n=1 Tax=Clostridium TaxID=1485 RepID=UPI001C8C6FA1|nr:MULTISPECIES: response regulator transcription factor [unclassified Clostridium]MBX9137153.1 response regulator transcription factor [Clostridium sp. K12(2020)]MBX9143996.1 response regulator transcription factor [Clostridium sp. K13]MDU2289082.1 response regulator transcription factor [Clostridium celatum]MDU4326201.1 response regulator transcription factor [Clostridium celatum]
MRKILIVEDEVSINDILTTSLKREGYDVVSAFTAREALILFDGFKPDLVLLDLMLPDGKGEEICKEIYKKACVIMITAKSNILDKLNGMEIGADDYITKPFDIREVKMRVKVALRRLEDTAVIENNKNLEKGLFIDIQKREVRKDGEVIKLSKKEFDIIWLLYSNKEMVFSREQLLNNVWGIDYYGDDRTIDVHIRRLREKLGEEKGQSIIETVFGVGYVMR